MNILEHLEEQGVFFTDFNHDKSTLSLTEACDGYNEVALNRDEVGQLIEELQALHADMT